MDIPVVAEFCLIGLVTGVLSGLFGVGGGFILVPLLIFAGVPIHLAVGTSLGYVTCTSMAGAYKHFINRNIHLRITTFLIIISSLTLITVGIRINRELGAEELKGAFAGLLIATALYFSLKRRPTTESERTPDSPKDFRIKSHWYTQLILGGMVGLLSGIFGVGGGFLLVPLLVLVVKMPIKLAMGTSLFVIIFASFVGALTHAFDGNVDLSVLAPLVVGGIAGAFVGASLTHRSSPKNLQKAFTGFLFFAALYMLYATL